MTMRHVSFIQNLDNLNQQYSNLLTIEIQSNLNLHFNNVKTSYLEQHLNFEAEFGVNQFRDLQFPEESIS